MNAGIGRYFVSYLRVTWRSRERALRRVVNSGHRRDFGDAISA